MEGKAMLAEQEAQAFSEESLLVGEPVTLVIEDERFFGWVASEAQAHSLVCVAIEFTRDGTRGSCTWSLRINEMDLPKAGYMVSTRRS